MTKPLMTAKEFRAAYEKLDLTQVEVAEFLGLTDRMVRRYASPDDPHEIPRPVAILLRLMVAKKMTVEQAAKIAGVIVKPPAD